MKNYVDVKVTVWYRHHFNDQTDMQQIIEMIRESGVDEVIDEEIGFTESEILYETDQPMIMEENGGDATVEVYKNQQCIWGNDEQK